MEKQLLISIALICLTFAGFSQEKQVEDQYFDVPHDLMGDRMRCIEQTIPLVFNLKVQSFVDYFTIRNRVYTKSVLAKKDLFFPMFEKILAEYGLPDELKYLSVVESGLRTNAISRAGAGGLWQFMPATGKAFGLKKSWYIDDRMNPELATRAACRYLKSLYKMFGDWELALAAYNAGPGNVRKAIRKSGYKKSFWGVYRHLPRETRSYVPQFVAIIYTFNYAEEHNFDFSDIGMEWTARYDTILVDNYMHLETLALQVGVCEQDLLLLNPQIVKGAIPEGALNYPLKVPRDLLDYIKENRTALLDSAGRVGKKKRIRMVKNLSASTRGKTHRIYRTRRGDALGSIARRHNVRVSDLKRWNSLNSNMIYVGQRLNIWVLPSYRPKTKQTYMGGKYHMVRAGESLWSISKLYIGVSIGKIKKLNNLISNKIKVGQRLLISM